MSKTSLIPCPSSCLIDCSKAVPLVHFFFAFAWVVSYEVFGLSLFVPRLVIVWCLGKAVLCDCGYPHLYFCVTP